MNDHPWISTDALITNDEGKILMIKRAKSEKTFPNMWGLVGGFMEWGETVEECVKREVREEIGIEIKDIEFVGRYYDKKGRHPTRTDITLLHRAKIKSGIPKVNQPEEISEVKWFTPEEIKEMELAFDYKEMLEDEGLI
tara:strand:+ start:623 stop:1039 length:417 start_codon:yes stop_codon:yes gene_type:complete